MISFFKKINFKRLFVLIFVLVIFIGILFLPNLINNIFNKKSRLTVCTFADLINSDLISKFEEDTGIEVSVKYCEMDSEFWTQLYMNNGEGFDVVTPTNLIVNQLKEVDFLKKIDKSKLDNFGGIDPKFSAKEFDLNLEYCVPFAWTFYAIGYNKKFFESMGVSYPTSLRALFEPQKFFENGSEDFFAKYKIALYEDDFREMLFLGALHLFGNENVLKVASDKGLLEVRDLFVDIKRKWLHAFIASNIRYYITFVVPTLLCFGSILIKDLLQNDSENFGMICPQEGSIIVEQNFCIPKGAKNIDAAHKFINYFISESCASSIFETSGYFSVKTKLMKKVFEDFPDLREFFPTKEQFERLIFTSKRLTARRAEQAWLSVKTNLVD